MNGRRLSKPCKNKNQAIFKTIDIVKLTLTTYLCYALSHFVSSFFSLIKILSADQAQVKHRISGCISNHRKQIFCLLSFVQQQKQHENVNKAQNNWNTAKNHLKNDTMPKTWHFIYVLCFVFFFIRLEMQFLIFFYIFTKNGRYAFFS